MTEGHGIVRRATLSPRPRRDQADGAIRSALATTTLAAELRRAPRALTGISGLETANAGQVRLAVRLGARKGAPGAFSFPLEAESWYEHTVQQVRADSLFLLSNDPSQEEIESVRRSVEKIQQMLDDLTSAWLYDYVELTALNKGEGRSFGKNLLLAVVGALFVVPAVALSPLAAAALGVGAAFVAAFAADGLDELGKTINASMQFQFASFIGFVSDLDSRVRSRLAAIAVDPAAYWDEQVTTTTGAVVAVSDLALDPIPGRSGARALEYRSQFDSLRAAARLNMWKGLLPAMYAIQEDRSYLQSPKTTGASDAAIGRWIRGYVEQYPHAIVWTLPREGGKVELRRAWLTTGDSFGVFDTVPSADFCRRLFADDGWHWDMPVAGSHGLSTRREVFEAWDVPRVDQLISFDRWQVDLIRD